MSMRVFKEMVLESSCLKRCFSMKVSNQRDLLMTDLQRNFSHFWPSTTDSSAMYPRTTTMSCITHTLILLQRTSNPRLWIKEPLNLWMKQHLTQPSLMASVHNNRKTDEGTICHRHCMLHKPHNHNNSHSSKSSMLSRSRAIRPKSDLIRNSLKEGWAPTVAVYLQQAKTKCKSMDLKWSK